MLCCIISTLLLGMVSLGCSQSSSAIESADLYQDYTDLPAGPHPAVFDSGQPVTLTYSPNAEALPSITGGRSVIAFRGAGKGSGYATGQLSATAAYLEADWNFGQPGMTDGGQLALCAFGGPLPSGPLGDIPVPDSPAHVVFLNDHFEYGVWQGNHLTILAEVPYGRAFTTETLHAAVYLRKDLGSAWVLAPTGTVYGPYNHPSIGSIDARYVTVEQFYRNADTDRRVEISSWHATSRPAEQ